MMHTHYEWRVLEKAPRPGALAQASLAHDRRASDGLVGREHEGD
jgi:hypothetical protein